MWIASTLGWFSIINKAPDEYHVRGRLEGDLINLARATGLPRHAVSESSRADYRWRIVVNEEGYRDIMAVLTETVDYPNFKDEIKKLADQSEKLDAYHEIWAVMFGVQVDDELRPYGSRVPRLSLAEELERLEEAYYRDTGL